MDYSVCYPLRSVKEIIEWKCSHQPFNVPFRVLSSSSKEEEGKKEGNLCICHDMAGGYLHDKSLQIDIAHSGFLNNDDGTLREPLFWNFSEWSILDTFVYFSHNLVSIPPASWTNSAHLHGVKMMGTVLAEWDEGVFKIKGLIGEGLDDGVSTCAVKLGEIARFHGFEGWLVNFESPVDVDSVPLINGFLECLVSCGCIVWWYDALTCLGQVRWQNCVNDLNSCFFESSHGIFLNYHWNVRLLDFSKQVAGERASQVWVGVDAWARHDVKNENDKFSPKLLSQEKKGSSKEPSLHIVKSRAYPSRNPQQSFFMKTRLKMIRNRSLSAAVFAPAWTVETLPPHLRLSQLSLQLREWDLWGFCRLIPLPVPFWKEEMVVESGNTEGTVLRTSTRSTYLDLPEWIFTSGCPIIVVSSFSLRQSMNYRMHCSLYSDKLESRIETDLESQSHFSCNQAPIHSFHGFPSTVRAIKCVEEVTETKAGQFNDETPFNVFMPPDIVGISVDDVPGFWGMKGVPFKLPFSTCFDCGKGTSLWKEGKKIAPDVKTNTDVENWRWFNMSQQDRQPNQPPFQVHSGVFLWGRVSSAPSLDQRPNFQVFNGGSSFRITASISKAARPVPFSLFKFEPSNLSNFEIEVVSVCGERSAFCLLLRCDGNDDILLDNSLSKDQRQQVVEGDRGCDFIEPNESRRSPGPFKEWQRTRFSVERSIILLGIDVVCFLPEAFPFEAILGQLRIFPNSFLSLPITDSPLSAISPTISWNPEGEVTMITLSWKKGLDSIHFIDVHYLNDTMADGPENVWLGRSFSCGFVLHNSKALPLNQITKGTLLSFLLIPTGPCLMPFEEVPFSFTIA